MNDIVMVNREYFLVVGVTRLPYCIDELLLISFSNGKKYSALNVNVDVVSLPVSWGEKAPWSDGVDV